MTGFTVVSTGENITHHVLSDHEDLMVVAFRFTAEGTIGAHHQHPRIQSEQTHGCICLGSGTLTDCLTPRRVDIQ